MLMTSPLIPPIPRDTARLAHAAFGTRNFYIQVGLNIEEILTSIQMDIPETPDQTASHQQTILAMVTFFQFVEGLIDEQVMDALRTRVEWKYALHYPMHPLLLNQAALCQFRQKNIHDATRLPKYQELVDQLVRLGPPIDHKEEKFEVKHMLSTLCALNLLEFARTTFSKTIEILAIRHPNWLRQIALPYWYAPSNRSESRFDPYASIQQQELLWQKLGNDINHLLTQIHTTGFQDIHELMEVKMLEKTWQAQFVNWNPPSAGQNLEPKLRDCTTCFHRHP